MIDLLVRELTTCLAKRQDADGVALVLLAQLPAEKRDLVRWAMKNHGHTLAEALEDLSEAGGL